MIPVVAELKEAFDAYKDDQESTGTTPELEQTNAPGASQQASAVDGAPESQASTPCTESEDMQRRAGTSGRSPETPQPNLTADTRVPNSVFTLQQLTGVVKTGQVQINQEVGESITKVLTHGLDKEIRDKFDTDIRLPSNCERMAVLGCNPEIYKKAPPEVKSLDRDLQNVQKSLLQGISALAQAVTKQNDASPATQHLLASALALCADASHELDRSRRRTFRPALKEEFKGLCMEDYPIEGFLFSKDLGEKVKALTDMNRIAKSVGKDSPQQDRQRRPFPFLGQGHQRKDGWTFPEATKSPTRQEQKRLHPYQGQTRPGSGQTAAVGESSSLEVSREEELRHGFKDSPRVFTKIMKPVLAHLRSKVGNSALVPNPSDYADPTSNNASLSSLSLVHPRKLAERHPIADRLNLMACLISGRD
ncbi:hypothetical protein EGW08_003628 [Elysia chlorotica]|uniref:Uncharacterized protein n=1 Tax=Elysia chlorotica TaxID=188477 RepID=A0A433U453_ELYCH|nr:hypothetical protein EGW08_003628 [Elysia chlorotica]